MHSSSDYLDLIGITQWQLRDVPVAAATSTVLIPLHYQAQSQWLFILEKQEASAQSSLLQAILAAVGQTLESVTIAYLDTQAASLSAPLLPELRAVVVMGKELVPQLQIHRQLYAPDIAMIISDNLSTLAHDLPSKRELWQQLKHYRS